jgi:hypothetical protein
MKVSDTWLISLPWLENSQSLMNLKLPAERYRSFEIPYRHRLDQE